MLGLTIPVGRASQRGCRHCQASVTLNGTKAHSVVSDIPPAKFRSPPRLPCARPTKEAESASCRPTDVNAKARLEGCGENTLRGWRSYPRSLQRDEADRTRSVAGSTKNARIRPISSADKRSDQSGCSYAVRMPCQMNSGATRTDSYPKGCDEDGGAHHRPPTPGDAQAIEWTRAACCII